jgi:hypothetical protein
MRGWAAVVLVVAVLLLAALVPEGKEGTTPPSVASTHTSRLVVPRVPLADPAEPTSPASRSVAPTVSEALTTMEPAKPASPAPNPSPPLTPAEQSLWSAGLDALGDARLSGRSRAINARLRYMILAVDHQDVPLAEVLRQLAETSGIPIEVTPDAAPLVALGRVSLSLRGVSLKNAMNLALASREDLVWTQTESGVWVDADDGTVEVDWIDSLQRVSTRALTREDVPSWVRVVNQTLDERRVTLHFQDTPLSEVVSFLQDITALNITVGASVDAQEIRVNAQQRRQRLRDVLDSLLKSADLGFVLENESLLMLPAAETARRRQEQREKQFSAKRELHAAAPILTARLPRGFAGTVAKAAAAIEEACGTRVLTNPAARASVALVSIPAGATVEEACERAALAAGLSWSLVRDMQAKERPHYLRWRGSHDALHQTLAGLIAWLGANGGDPRVRVYVREAEEAWRSLGDHLATASVARTLAELRAALVEVGGLTAKSLGAVIRGVGAVDALHTREGERAAPARVLRVANLAAFASTIPLGSGRCREVCQRSNESPRTLTLSDCFHQGQKWIRDLALWLGRTDRLSVADHPGACFLSPK